MPIEPNSEEKMMDEKLQERFNALPKALQNAITSADVEKKLRRLSEVHKLHLDQWQKLENEVMLALLGFQPLENLEANIKKEVGMPDADAEALAGDIADTIFQPIREELERELGVSATEETGEPVASSLQPVAGNLTEPVADFFPGNPGSKNRVETEHSFDEVKLAPTANSPIQTPAQTMIENLPPRPVDKPVVGLPAGIPAQAGSLQPVARETQDVIVAPPPPAPSTPPPAPPATKSVRATLSPAYAPNTKSHERTTVDDDPYREPTA